MSIETAIDMLHTDIPAEEKLSILLCGDYLPIRTYHKFCHFCIIATMQPEEVEQYKKQIELKDAWIKKATILELRREELEAYETARKLIILAAENGAKEYALEDDTEADKFSAYAYGWNLKLESLVPEIIKLLENSID